MWVFFPEKIVCWKQHSSGKEVFTIIKSGWLRECVKKFGNHLVISPREAMQNVGPFPNVTMFVLLLVIPEAVSVRVLMGIPGRIIEKDLSLLTQTTVVSFFSEPVGEN